MEQLQIVFKDVDFSDDKEKMKDFYILSKLEFLKSYSYLTEREYDNTKRRVSRWAKRVHTLLKSKDIT